MTRLETFAMPDPGRRPERRLSQTGEDRALASACGPAHGAAGAGGPTAPPAALSAGQLPDALAIGQMIAAGTIDPLETVAAAVVAAKTADQRFGLLARDRYERALKEAERLAGDPVGMGPLTGVPILVSDYGLAGRGERFTRGTRFLAEFVASHDSPLWRRYRQTGAIVLGVARTAEFALTMTTEPTLYGPTRNPASPRHSAGGGCGGAAAAVAAGVVPIAHASDLMGGMRIPAALCGVFALKPTRNRIPTGPRRTEAWAGLDTSHVLTRTVRDSAAMLDLTSGGEGGEYHAVPEAPRSYLRLCQSDPGPLRIAVTWRTPTGSRVDARSALALDRVVELLRGLGHEVFEAEPRFQVDAMADAVRLVVAANLAHELTGLSHAVGQPVREDLVEPLTWALYLEGLECTASRYIDAHETLQRTGPRFANFFEEFDLSLTPAFDGTPPRLGDLEEVEDDLDAYWALMNASAPYTLCYNVTGHPALVMPVMRDKDGLPVAVQVGAGFGREDLLFQLAGQLERALTPAPRAAA